MKTEDMKMELLPKCAMCPGAYCRLPPERVDEEVLPQACPMRNSPDLIKEMIKRYSTEQVRNVYIPATITEKEAYETIRGVRMAVRPRIKEVVEYYKLIDAKRVGVAFCAGLRDEAKLAVDFLEMNGLTVASVMCKCGGLDKTRLHVESKYKIGDPSQFEAACNPLTQAELLNRARTDFNVLIGLCVGHDMLFTSNSKAPVTTLIVKDRMLGHNPVTALYSGYHRDIVKSQRRT